MFKLVFSCLALLLATVLYAPSNAAAADAGNCLLCHKYPGFSRIDSEGKFRLFYINEDTFNNSVHAKVKCADCHTDVKKIPHDPVKKVDCLTQCHIVEPSSETKFSHRNVATFLENSVHAKNDPEGNPKQFSEDMPSCKSCHDNPLYRPLSFFKNVRPGISDTAVGRCRVCHKQDEFIFRFYNHVTTRLHKIRNPKNISEVCARCHDNPELVERHGLSTRASVSYGETFHGKAANFLDERIPDCLDCHVNTGRSVHQMLSKEDPNASTHVNNKEATCSSIECHPAATAKLSDYDVHAEFDYEKSPVQYYFTTAFITLAGGTLLPLMGIIFLDLTRRLFPNATLRRRKKKNAKA